MLERRCRGVGGANLHAGPPLRRARRSLLSPLLRPRPVASCRRFRGVRLRRAPISSFGPRLTPYTQLHQTGVGGFVGSRVMWRLAGKTSACVRSGVLSTVMRGMSMNVIPPTTSSPNAAATPVVLLSVRDVCAALQCGRTFVYDLLQKGELRAIKLGRLTRIPRAVLEDFIARSEDHALDGAWAGMHHVERRSGVRAALAPRGKTSRRPKPSVVDSRTVQQCLLDADG